MVYKKNVTKNVRDGILYNELSSNLDVLMQILKKL